MVPATIKRAGAFVALLVFAWLIWDTGADPVRLARGLPWIFDFLRRMMPPDLSVLPAALWARSRRSRSRCSAPRWPPSWRCRSAFSRRATWRGAVFYPARAVLASSAAWTRSSMPWCS
jgi:hypothetical protein